MVTYFVLTFLISWGGILVVLGPGAFTGAAAPTEGLLPLVFLAMFAGPSVAGILMTGLVNGKAGFHDLRSRLRRWRVGVTLVRGRAPDCPPRGDGGTAPRSRSASARVFLPGVVASEPPG